jgi:catechol 2,3-dioxygenase-like lactoylglutathione lyase family enzyme
MKILSIDHVQIAMPSGEEDKARAFYGDILGFTEIPKPAELAKRGGAWFQNVPTAVARSVPSGIVQLHLGIEQDFRPARKAHPAFIVDELDTLITKAENAGYETDTTQPPLNGFKRAHVFDPFGNRIELMQRL